jgi:thiol-disulfide isomerase/thioredoxin
MNATRSWRRAAIGVATGVVASGTAVGLTIGTAAGADLARVCWYVAAAFFAAGLACGGVAARHPMLRAAAISVGGCGPVIALAMSGIGFASLAWLGAYVVTATVFATTGAVVRASSSRRMALRAVAVSGVAWGVLIVGGRAVAARLVGGTAIERATRAIAPFTLVGVDGRELRSADVRGRIVVLAFWATWCVPCRAELPELVALADHYRSDPRVVVWWVNAGLEGDTPEHARERVTSLGSTRDLVLGFDRGQLVDSFGIAGLPAIVVLDRDGRFRLRHDGYDESEPLAAKMTQEIDHLLASDER